MDKQFDHLILDLGGVLYDLDYSATERAFKDLGFDMQFSRLKQAPIIDEFEEGKVSEEQFFDFFKSKVLGRELQNSELKDAWNKMLLGLKKDKLDLLKSLRSKYDLYLYSNTNDTHIKAVFDHFREVHGVQDFASFFNGMYLSNEIGLRKPKPDGFIQIIQNHQLNPKRILFIDDSPQHVKGAIEAGIHGEWLNLQKEDVFQMLERLGV